MTEKIRSDYDFNNDLAYTLLACCSQMTLDDLQGVIDDRRLEKDKLSNATNKQQVGFCPILKAACIKEMRAFFKWYLWIDSLVYNFNN